MKSLVPKSGCLSPGTRYRCRTLALAVLAALPCLAHADEQAPDSIHVYANIIDGQENTRLSAKDQVRVERGTATLISDQAYMDLVTNDVFAEGNVLLVRNQNTIRGPRARVNIDTWFGEFETPAYTLSTLSRRTSAKSKRLFIENQRRTVIGSGHADVLKLEGENQYRLHNATYSSCEGPDPDWYLRVSDLKLDTDRMNGEGHGTVIVFKDIPILYSPWLQFPLDGRRQSGLLPPSLGSTSNTGADMMVPYYLNLAPNYDLTLAPRLMSRRGMQLGGEARYLSRMSYSTLRGEYIQNDQVTKTTRSLVAFKHNQNFGYGLTGAIDYNSVSDKTYFADMSSKIASTSTANLNRQLTLNYGNGSWLTSTLQVQKFQNIKDDQPYERLPQLTVLARQPDLAGFSLLLPAEFASFSHPVLDKGQRSVLYPQISYPIQGAEFYLTPKLGMHISSYQLERRTTVGQEHLTRAVPTFSLDAGLNFERDFSLGNKDYIQTLEPRLYYVKTTYRDQSLFPVFDTARADFNFAQIFSENAYVGQDRIADASQVTAGVQSRLIRAETGEQWLSMALAQRYYFSDQRVTLPGETVRTGRVADILAAVSGKAFRDLTIDAALQYDPREDMIQRTSLGLRYQPDFAKVASLTYRYKKNEIRDINVTGQWPLWGNWYGVARYNRNLRDHTISAALGGLEYKAGCWVFRSVWQTLLNTSQRRNNSYFFQIEFNDFAAFGNNPINLLSTTVDGYGKINEAPIGSQIFSNAP